MPEATLGERISVETLALVTLRVTDATNPLSGTLTIKEGWAEAVQAMRYCLAWGMLRYADPERQPDEAWFERCQTLERGLNSAMRRLFKEELGVDLPGETR